MIQFNLLPDVKIEYIKTKYRKRLIMLISAVATGICLTIFIILLLFVRVSQKQHIKSVDKDIEIHLKEISETKDLDKILTIQNQLNSLTGLHDQKIVSSRLIDYVAQITPTNTTVSAVSVDFEVNSMTIKGRASDIATVNKFVDTLKFTEYKVNNTEENSGSAFKDVVLTSFSIPGTNNGQGVAEFGVSLNFDPAIFAQVKDVKDGFEAVTLNIPQKITTRSETEKPNTEPVPQSEPLTGEGR